MKTWMRFGMVSAALVGAVLVAGPALAAPGQVTVGQFLVEIAKAKSLVATDGNSAVSALRGAGVSVPAIDLGKTLTEGDVVAIGSAAGLRFTTSNPGAPFTSGQVDQFLVSFGSELGTSAGDDPSTRSHDGSGSNSSKGKGKKKGHNKTPSDPV